MHSKEHQALLDQLGPEDRAVVNWMYEVTKAPAVGVILWGIAHSVATDHQDWSFWQVAREVKRRAEPVFGNVQ
jgi:hypothetical protein